MGDISPNLSRYEIRCKCGCGRAGCDYVTVILFEKVRMWLGGVAMTPTSGFRCPEHNRREGGGEKSYHLQGRAIDFWHPNYSPEEVLIVIEREIPHQFGVGTYPDKGFTHIDSGPFRRWRG